MGTDNVGETGRQRKGRPVPVRREIQAFLEGTGPGAGTGTPRPNRLTKADGSRLRERKWGERGVESGEEPQLPQPFAAYMPVRTARRL